MRELVFEEPGRLSWRDVPEPKLDMPLGALVHPIAVALCDADIAALRGRFPVQGRFSFGHEFVAEVVEVGDGVEGWESGALAIVPVQISCGTCRRCRRGLTASCTSVRQPAAYGLGPFGGSWPGAFSDLVVVPFAEHMLVPVPAGVDPHSVSSVGDNVSDAWRAVAPHLRAPREMSIFVVGGGSIGLYAVAIAVALGVRRVDYLDTDATRNSLAERLGANVIEGQIGMRVGSYPITVDASFRAEGPRTALLSTGVDGVCTSVFPGFDDVEIPVFDMWRRGVRFHTGVANCRANMPSVVELVSSGVCIPNSLLRS